MYYLSSSCSVTSSNERSGEGFKEDSEALGAHINEFNLPFDFDNERFAISGKQDLRSSNNVESGGIRLKWLPVASFMYHMIRDSFSKSSQISVTRRVM
jgi:hypothetical protein